MIIGILKNARLLSRSEHTHGPCLRGQIYADMKHRFHDGDWITTSRITKKEGNVFATLYSTYEVASWAQGEEPKAEPMKAANDDKPGYDHAAAINLFAADCHAASRKAGWYTDLATGKLLDRNVPEMLMLIVSEISEAMEGYRKNLQDDKLPARKMVEVELADAMIRIGDLATFIGCDLGGAVVEKMAFNANRPDHKIEARKAVGGKAF
jgi:hypothetical protein